MGLLSCGGPIFLLLPHRRNDIIWKINFKPQSWSLCAPFFIKSKLYFSTTLYCLILRCRAPFGHHRTKFLYALLIGRAPQVRHHGHHFAELRPQSEQHAKKKSLETIEAQGICGGSGGIRTHVPLRTTWFRVTLVTTTSIRFRIEYSIYSILSHDFESAPLWPLRYRCNWLWAGSVTKPQSPYWLEYPIFVRLSILQGRVK